MEHQEILWKDDLATGIRLIDSQHREFIGLVNKFLDSSIKPEDESEIRKSFGFLRYYINEHFSVEEAAMAEYGYPNYAMHKNIHVCFREEFERLEFFLNNKVQPHDVFFKLNYLVVNWFMSHIRIDDKRLCEYLLAQEEERKESLLVRLERIAAMFFKAKEND